MTGTASSSSVVPFFLLCFLFSMFTPRETRAETKFTIDAALSRIDVSVDATFPQVSDAQLKRWVQNAADAVVAYYGRYSVPHVFLQIRPFDGKGVRGGRTFSMRGGLIRIAVGNFEGRPWRMTSEAYHRRPGTKESCFLVVEGNL